MIDLERKLAEALRERAGEVRPNLDAAWAEQQRRQRRSRAARRRLTVVVAPLAAALVLLTSVLMATRLQLADSTLPASPPGEPFGLPKPVYYDGSVGFGSISFSRIGTPVGEFTGQTDRWTTYAVTATTKTVPARTMFCLLASPGGVKPDGTSPQYGMKSPTCVPLSTAVVRSGYVGEDDGPLPAGKAIYLVDPAARELRLFDAKSDPSQAKAVGMLGSDQLFLADVHADSPPVRFQVSWSTPAHPAGR
ncbi:hypothetical protein DMA12_13360 [Amycolatopsis balhimycina DSM 5908]|uniref:Uncharacterized protein n=1 Tax=Amycolatopsis balhimycina DSM 5908 TaxID=1081091 RepID=A0A428WQZ6_AMYBA|nr:hypothetical protein [Amycolatopsis balhimycina]RSM45448.1 hypothetical protein DMA12_13360 [Amycolatopsis balhimycina DSM 5908]